MKPGDIIAFKPNKNTKRIFSKILSLFSRITVGNWLVNNEDSFNHVAILAEDKDYIYESKYPIGGKNKINYEEYDVYVLEAQLDEDQRERILTRAREGCSIKYDVICILTFGLIKIPRRSVCSQFVADCYLDAGISLRKDGEILISPNEVVYNPIFTKNKIN